ncbi:MAG: 3-hydroxyacyl-ACP dehydratase [Deltaproteobacteria bacterium]|nr:3-hydroxyacyl-ACP dehydratase [Deltaproteobacteria bacterium]
MNAIKRAIHASAVGPMAAEAKVSATKRYCFSPDFIGFSGHFPGYPILPAFVQIMMACSLAEELQGRALELATIEKAKFLLEIGPDQEIVVQIRDRTIGTRPGCEVRLVVKDGVAASFRMSFEGEEASTH